ncbi:MAG: NeuD/PglB/VioB family sugar acetyltransferase [Chitinophagaceae bacterium]
MIEKLVLIGAGGHAKSAIGVIEAGKEFTIHGLIDGAFPKGHDVLGYPVLGDNDVIAELSQDKSIGFLIAVGQVNSPAVRMKLFSLLEEMQAQIIEKVTAPSAFVSTHSTIGKGTLIMHHCIVNTSVRIGNNAILNNRCLVEHDATVGDHVHVSTGAIINGGCNVGDRVFVGSGAVLVHGISIASDVVIGAGAVVRISITKPGTYAGNPLRRIRS